MSQITTKSPKETKEFAKNIIEKFSCDNEIKATATIIALQGDLGTGKTVFTKGVAEFFGLKDVVTSPTFVIEKKYNIPNNFPWKKLIHIDAYRLEGEEDLSVVSWSEIATNPNNLIVVEWPENAGLGIPERALWLEFEFVDENTRKIKIPENFFQNDCHD
jgi:tRNA threonylcarbamoyladenosine biosynthesis protein TsaE